MGRDTVNTGIKGLDILLGGGIPRGATVLISGFPGAGKTIMSLEYAFNQAKKGERVLYISTGEPIYKVNRFASSLSFYDLDLINVGVGKNTDGHAHGKGFVEFQDYSLGEVMDEQFSANFFEDIRKKVGRRSIDHIIIDSITPINMLIGDEKEKRRKMLLFNAWVSSIGCTTILTAECSEEDTGIERYLADGIIDLKRVTLQPELYDHGGMQCRTIEVTKLRGKHHFSGRYLYSISGDGIKVFMPGTSGHIPCHQAALTGISVLDANIGGMAYGTLWHFNANDAVRFEPIADTMMREALNSGDGLLCISCGGKYLASMEILKQYLGDVVEKAIAEQRIAIIDTGRVSPAEDLKDALLLISPEDAGNGSGLLSMVKMRLSMKGKRWRIFVDLPELIESCGASIAKKICLGLLDLSYSYGSLLITYNDILNADKPVLDALEPRASGVIDIRDYDGYTLLYVKKAPCAYSFEPFMIREEGPAIRLMQL